MKSTMKYDTGMKVKFQVPKEMTFQSVTNATNTVSLSPGDKAAIVKEAADGKYLVNFEGTQIEVPGAYLSAIEAAL
jgi:hypothetical protein